MGNDLKSWHIIAIGQYPHRKNFLKLLTDKAYQTAFKHGQAAVENQHVYFINAM